MLLATRNLIFQRPEGNHKVVVNLHAPEPGPHDWSCKYEIEWPQGPTRFAAHGVDSMQATVLALQMICSELYASDAHALGRLHWEQPGDGYGFPPPPGFRDIVVGQDKKFF